MRRLDLRESRGIVSKWAAHLPSSAGGNPGEFGVQWQEHTGAGEGGVAFYLGPLASQGPSVPVCVDHWLRLPAQSSEGLEALVSMHLRPWTLDTGASGPAGDWLSDCWTLGAKGTFLCTCGGAGRRVEEREAPGNGRQHPGLM